MIVNLDWAWKSVVLSVNQPRGLPLSSPKGIKVSVNAADIHLQVSILVEAEACTSGSLLVVSSDIAINGSLNAGPKSSKMARLLTFFSV